MPVCLHCGEIGADGALFCGKCGYTLPQPEGPTALPGARPSTASVGGPPAPPMPPAPPAASAPLPPPGFYPAPGPHVVLAGAPAGATGPLPPPPNAKFCVRCATPIARAAVYCPVCQQPQP